MQSHKEPTLLSAAVNPAWYQQMAKTVVPGLQERLRSIVGSKGWDYVVYWKLNDDQRSIAWVGCCCSGVGLHSGLGADYFTPSHYLEGGSCPDISIPHAATKICLFLSEMASSISLNSGVHGQVLLSGQPRWVNFPNSGESVSEQDGLQTRVYIPIQNGIVELGASNHVTENGGLIQYVKARCGDSWQDCNINAPKSNVQSYSYNTRSMARSSQEGSEVHNLSTLDEAVRYQGFQDSIDQGYKSFYTNSGADADLMRLNAPESDAVQWPLPSDPHNWGQDSETQFFLQIAPSQMNFLGQPKQNNSNQAQRHGQIQEHFEGTGDSSRSDKGIQPFVQCYHDMGLPPATNNQSILSESPHGSGLSKENSDREVKHETRADSSDCSDQMEDDEEKGVSRSGRRHLSKNLVAERKRRKKLNERLYSLRSLVPKITKMDRASILGDAIEYVKELQQQVKELQEELLENKDDDLNHPKAATSDDPNPPLADDGLIRGTDITSKADLTLEDRKIEELTQPMQVEVSKMDTHLFTLRIFCEKRPGVFVKLMQALDVLGLDVLHANITTFRGLVLNVFNAEIRDKELMQAEQVKETLLEMTSQPDHHAANLSRDGNSTHVITIDN